MYQKLSLLLGDKLYLGVRHILVFDTLLSVFFLVRLVSWSVSLKLASFTQVIEYLFQLYRKFCYYSYSW